MNSQHVSAYNRTGELKASNGKFGRSNTTSSNKYFTRKCLVVCSVGFFFFFYSDHTEKQENYYFRKTGNSQPRAIGLYRLFGTLSGSLSFPCLLHVPIP